MKETAARGFDEDGHRVSWALTCSELEQVHALRAEVFCRELGWVGDAGDTAERDAFDAGSVHVAVMDPRDRVVAAVRLTGFDAPWMLDSVFRSLAGPELVAKAPWTAEASRLVVAKTARTAPLRSGRRTCDLIYKGAYAYCATNGIRHLYIVTSNVVLRHMLRTGLPCDALADPTRMPDGVKALAARVDWTRIPDRPSIASWYESGWAPAAQPSEEHAPPRCDGPRSLHGLRSGALPAARQGAYPVPALLRAG